MDFSMKDPTTASSRIYIGNIGETATRNDIENIFCKYGNIRGVMISRNFGFVQFESDESANNAIMNEHENKYFNRKIIVKKPLDKIEKGNQGINSNPNRNQGNQSNQVNQVNQVNQGNQVPGNQNLSQKQAQNQSQNQHQQSFIQNQNAGNQNNLNQIHVGGQNQNGSQNLGGVLNLSGSQNLGDGQNEAGPSQGPSNQLQKNQGGQLPNNNFGNNDGSNNNNFNNNNNSSKSSGVNVQQNQDNFNRGQRQPWMKNRRGNNNNNNNNNNNRQSDRDRSPIDSPRGFGNIKNNVNPWSNNPDQGNNRSNNNNNFRSNNMNSNIDPSMMNQNNFGMNQRNMSDTRPMNDNMNNSSRGQIGGGVPMPGNPSAQMIRAKHPDSNDCEIIVLAKPLTEYAEAIESRLKRLGLLVDLLFPNPDVAITKVLANIASRGALFAIVVAPANLEMRSVSVNILYGQPVEHRNMPLDDAIEFIFKNFQRLIRGEPDNDEDDANSQIASIPHTEMRHPDSIQHLINILKENRVLTVLQFDVLIKYLQERKDVQYKIELGESANTETSGSLQQPEIDPEAELQKRIMEILNKPSITNLNTDSSITKTVTSTEVRRESRTEKPQEPPLLNDPKVQRALDSLLSNNTFNF